MFAQSACGREKERLTVKKYNEHICFLVAISRFPCPRSHASDLISFELNYYYCLFKPHIIGASLTFCYSSRKCCCRCCSGFSFVSQLLQLMILFSFIYYLWKCSVWLFRNFIAFIRFTEQFVSVFEFDSHLESFFHSEQAPTLWFYTNSNVKPRLKVQQIGKCVLHNFYLVIVKQI